MGRASGKVEAIARESTVANSGAAGDGAHHLRREIGGIVLLALSLFFGLSVASLQFGAGNLMGPFGAVVGTCLYALLGLGSYAASVVLGIVAVRMLRGLDASPPVGKSVAVASGLFFGAILLHLATGHYRLRGYSTGGVVGEYGAELMVAVLGTAGTVLFGLTGLLLSAVATTRLRAAHLGRAAAGVGRTGWSGFRRLAIAVLPSRDADDDDEDLDDEREETAPAIIAPVPPPLASTAETRKTLLPTRKMPAPVVIAPTPVAIAPTPRAADATVPVPPPSFPDDADRPRRLRETDATERDVALQQAVVPAPAPVIAPTPVVAPAPVPSPLAAALQAASAEFVAAQQISPALVAAAAIPSPAPIEATDPMPAPEPARRRRAAAPSAAMEPSSTAPNAAAPILPITGDSERTEAQLGVASEAEAAAPVAPLVAAPPAPTIVAPVRPKPVDPALAAPREPAPAPHAKAPADYIRLGDGDFRLPDVAFLDYQDPGHGELDRQAMLDLAQRLEKTLADYGVRGRVSEIHPGPVVTMYEFVPQAGTKLSKITALSNDLAMALEALKVRIVAPIPGKAAVGIEVPNRVRETVFLKEIIGSEGFARSKSKLTMALGKDIGGAPVCVDLAKMPHLLVAGTTGSGKSVSVNAMICSILFNSTPDDVKMIMIDPKMLELSIYEGIPHLLLPVVTDPKKANLALRWAVEEMERRYDLISKSGVRDLASYNKKVEKLLAEDKPAAPSAPQPRTVRVPIVDAAGELREIECEPDEQAVIAAGGVITEDLRDEISAARAAMHKEMQQLELAAVAAASVPPPKKLPYIVIIIDEFADLMMVASKEVEQSVARIAQKARAAGIHLLLATQRPSVDVITGLIKANFPSRIAFQVASRIDARTILDQQGAESLLGMGDMLFTDRGLAVKRVHGPLVTDGEIHKIVEFLKAQGQPVYDLDILKPRVDEDGEGEEGADDLNDEMYDQAVAIISEMRQASTSMLQRRLRLGYNRAARIIERMEREGIVGPADGAKPREVLVHSHAA